MQTFSQCEEYKYSLSCLFIEPVWNSSQNQDLKHWGIAAQLFNQAARKSFLSFLSTSIDKCPVIEPVNKGVLLKHVFVNFTIVDDKWSQKITATKAGVSFV